MTAVVSAMAGVLGLLLGSFANVAIHRWPRGGSVRTPSGSHCPSCDAPIAWYDNVPVLSWVRLRGRCRSCGEPIAWRYPVTEALVAVLFAATAAVHGVTWLLPALLVFVWSLVVASIIDLEHYIIPNVLTYRLPFVLLPLLVLAAATAGEWADLRRAVIAGVGVPGAMLLVSETYRLVRGRVGMGMGDVKLAISIGLVVGYLGGWQLVIFAYGSIIGAVAVAVVLLVAGRVRLAGRIPFGPYLAIGALVAVLAGDPLADVLSRWLGL
jgi:leader peptidase (prepilin peptidase)/N-methyltransferase